MCVHFCGSSDRVLEWGDSRVKSIDFVEGRAGSGVCRAGGIIEVICRLSVTEAQVRCGRIKAELLTDAIGTHQEQSREELPTVQ